MPNENGTCTVEKLRTRLLVLLDSHPDPQHSDVLFLRALAKKRVESGVAQVVEQLCYLSERGLVQVEIIAAGRCMATITERGREFLDGKVEEDGLADPRHAW